MKRLIGLCLLISGYSVNAQQYAPANRDAVIEAGENVRFTVLTPNLIRMEWTENGEFVDDASFVIVNRKTEVPGFKVKKRKGHLVIVTDSLELSYKVGSGKFTRENLKIRSLGTFKYAWNPGSVQKENLLGTSRTLDGYNGDVRGAKKTKMKLEQGLLSRDGWHLLDDSKTLLFDGTAQSWVKERTRENNQDWYFFGYGSNYKQALSDYSKIAGKMPLPPRFAFGFWWSRYWSYSDKELRDLVAKYEEFDMPMDVLVIDMDWHTTDSTFVKDEFGWSKSWTGWTWNKRLFPDPRKFLSWTKTRKLKTTLNLHPSSGIAPHEEKYAEFAEKMVFDTSTGRNIPFVGSDKKFMNTLFDVILDPIRDQGVDFWWLDWQQWIYDKKMKSLNNTWWLNYVFFSRMERETEKRPLIYHRWGGLGNHRYQIGFSGDTYTTWNSLEYQPYFTNTASNVLYGYWSHDIGGHMGGGKFDEELFVRWFQYGVFSPILRTHCSKRAAVTFNKEPWTMTEHSFEAYRQAIKLRYALAPYIYTMAREAYDTGLSLCRPMYYDYPLSENAYRYSRQYQFGDRMIVAPIGTKSEPETGKSSVACWLPEGDKWFEWCSGTLFDGGQELVRDFALDEYPVYIRAGSVVPMYKDVKNLTETPDELVISVFPGGDGSFDLYEDEGDNRDYADNYAVTRIVSTVTPGRYADLVIDPLKGVYRGMKSSRSYEIRYWGSFIPANITVDGREIVFDESLQEADCWKYDGATLSVVVRLSPRSVASRTAIRVNYDTGQYVDVNNGLVRRFKRLTDATIGLKYRAFRVILPSPIGELEQTSIALEYDPGSFRKKIDFFNKEYENLPRHMDNIGHISQDAKIWYKNNYK